MMRGCSCRAGPQRRPGRRTPAKSRIRYRRAVVLADLRRAWEASPGVLEPVFDAWLRPLADGDGERFGFSTQGARLEGPGRPPARLSPGWGSLALRATRLGPQAPAALLRGWFPGA